MRPTPFVLLFLQNFLIWCAVGSTSLIPAYLTTLGASQTFVGFYNILGILLIVAVVVFFGRPLVKLPRVLALRWGLVFLMGASILSWVFADSLVLLMVFKLLGSVAQVFGSTLMVSILIDLTPSEKRAGSLAVFSIGGMLTNPVSSLIGEAVLRTFGGQGLFLQAASFALLAFFWTLTIKEPVRPPHNEPQAFHEVVTRPDMRWLLILAFAFGIYYSAMASFLPHQTQSTLGEANLSAFLIPFSAVSIVLRLLFRGQLDKRPPRRFLYLSFLAIFGSQVCLILPAGWIWIAMAGLLYGIGHSILFPLMNSLFVQVGGEDQKAVYSNAYTVANLTGAILMTPLLGALGDFWGFQSIVAVLAAVALASFFLVRRRFPRPSEIPAANLPSDRSS